MTKRQQQKLILTVEERGLIKGLIKHSGLNDQMIVAIFSHKSRTINHREVAYFRDENNSKYKGVKASNKETVEAFLSKYGKFEQLIKLNGLLPKEDYFDLIHKASEAMKNAVAIHNNPNIKWKTETFIVNAVIAWTYLMHAYYMANNIDYVYRHADGQPKLSDEGRPLLWELSKCIKDTNICPLPKTVVTNLKYLIAIRNEIVHSMCENLDTYLGGKLQACALNFNRYLCEWFGDVYSMADELAFSIQFCALSLQSHSDVVGKKDLPTVIKTVNGLFEKDLGSGLI